MKVAQIENNNLVIKQRENETLDNRKGALLKVLGCGLCGSDIVKLTQHISKDGTVLGHEIVGQIIDINSGTSFKNGDVIITSHHIPCGKCEYCKNGNVSMCRHFKETNIKPGGFSEFVFVSEEHLQNVVYIKPENLTNDESVFYEPLGCCIRAVKRANLNKNSTALVIGLGSIGILMAQALRAFGMKVIGCDLLNSRVELLKNLGIEAFNVSEMCESINADGVFMTSGSDKALPTALKYVRDGGKILVFSSTPQNTGYANNEIYYRELTVLGSYSPSPADLKDSYELLKNKEVKVKGLSTYYPLEQVQKAINDTLENKILKAYIQIG
ncbi:alcohol dehydrogenase catalytic domain-containing protein [bacterium]|nr:alcohol dehydrogenase catalytic domain-containing protein [bacterium]MBR1620467.1 alcohol dehydrogenase catalytic domain-containing protein [bacterium]